MYNAKRYEALRKYSQTIQYILSQILLIHLSINIELPFLNYRVSNKQDLFSDYTCRPTYICKKDGTYSINVTHDRIV